MAQAAGGQEGPLPATDTASTEDEIVVVGSRLAGGPAKTGTLPVEVIGADEIAATGATTLQQVLTQLPSAAGAMKLDGSDIYGVASINLRGLGDRYTLVLVNGRRIVGEGPGNLNLIPTNAIERIEVLKTGASAVYGTDALAGVVNVVLKKSDDGLRASLRYGAADRGGLSTLDGSLSFGTESETTRFYAIAGYYKREPLRQADRGAGSNDARAFGGYDGRSDFTSPANFDLNGVQYILNTDRVGPGQFSNNPADYRPFDFERDAHDRAAWGATFIGESERYSGYVSLEHDLSPSTTLYGDLMAKTEKMRVTAGSNVLPIGEGGLIGPVPASNPYNPFGTDISGLNLRLLDLGQSGTIVRNREIRASVGIRGELGGGWKYDVGTDLYSGNQRISFFGSAGFSSVGLRAALNRTGADALNPFCNRCNTPAQLAGVKADLTTTQKVTAWNISPTISGELFDTGSGPVKLLFGVEYRNLVLTEDYSTGLQDGTDLFGRRLVPFKYSRNSKSVFGELKIPLLGEGEINPERLGVSIATRYERFSDAGGAFVPAVSAALEAVPGFLVLRASYNKAFNAPFLSELNQPETFYIENFNDPRNNNQPLRARFVSGGDPNLKPEKADNFSAGFVIKPSSMPGLTFGVDYFSIRQRDVIVAPDANAIVLGRVVPARPFVEGVNVDGAGSDIIIYQNLFNGGSKQFSGLDGELSYSYKMGEAALKTTITGSYLLDVKLDTGNGAGSQSVRGTYDPSFGAYPRFRSRAIQSATIGPVSASVTLNHVSSLQDAVPGGVMGSARIGAYDTVDLNAMIDIGKITNSGVLGGTVLTVGIDNIGNRRSPFILGLNEVDLNGTYDLRERFFYVGISKKF
ncbi:TonB-dependent receptor plug domain-containing protein [Sphingomonas alpina]|uniref:TonB-dependent receptor plug domain-containing protein n=1 Tax=Sphingomonas alpina TaxID=653931 RepID=UPI0021BB7B97|nr:TonB-dependent receptor [Sphingomonas alpina]